MLLIDRILECDDKSKIVALKNVTVNEPFFEGHFPGIPIMPGVLQLEVMAQAAGVLLNRITDMSHKVPYFLSVDNCRFRKVVKPGDQMRVEVEFMKFRGRLGRFHGEVLVEGEVASEADMMCMITDSRADV